MKSLLFISIIAISLSCTKENLKLQNKNPDYLSIFDAGDGDFMTPDMIIKIWYTVEDDLYTIAETFEDEISGYYYYDLQNNPKSYFYKKAPDKIITITAASYDTQKRIAAMLSENKFVLAEMFLIPMSNDHEISRYNFLYLSYINTNQSQSFIARCDAFRAGI